MAKPMALANGYTTPDTHPDKLVHNRVVKGTGKRVQVHIRIQFHRSLLHALSARLIVIGIVVSLDIGADAGEECLPCDAVWL